MRTLNHICVFCGASTPNVDVYQREIEHLADEMVSRDIGLVYGGGSVGLMGAVADRVLLGGGRVIGVIPHQMQARELAHHGLTELLMVDSMHERKRLMYDRSDAFVVFPGGFGTLDEAMEILTWKQLAIHDKPVVFVNINGYFDHLRAWVDRSIQDGLVQARYIPLFHFVDDVPALFEYLSGYEPHQLGLKPWA